MAVSVSVAHATKQAAFAALLLSAAPSSVLVTRTVVTIFAAIVVTVPCLRAAHGRLVAALLDESHRAEAHCSEQERTDNDLLHLCYFWLIRSWLHLQI